MKRVVLLLSCLSFSHAFALDGKALYVQKLCHTCHGPADQEGKAPIAPNYPKTAGQSSVYCQEQAKFIRDGKRTSGLAVVMKGMVAAVKDDEFKAICDFLEGVK